MCTYRVERDSNHVETCWFSLSLFGVILYLSVGHFEESMPMY